MVLIQSIRHGEHRRDSGNHDQALRRITTGQRDVDVCTQRARTWSPVHRRRPSRPSDSSSRPAHGMGVGWIEDAQSEADGGMLAPQCVYEPVLQDLRRERRLEHLRGTEACKIAPGLVDGDDVVRELDLGRTETGAAPGLGRVRLMGCCRAAQTARKNGAAYQRRLQRTCVTCTGPSPLDM